MAGTFELFVDVDACFRFRLRGPDGAVLAVSTAFVDKPAAVAGITAVREYAGMGLISDLCPSGAPDVPAAPRPKPASTTVPGVDRRVHDNDLRIRARALRRPAHGGAIGVV
ncbi:YegP family protein [Arthrobacter sp. TE12232]